MIVLRQETRRAYVWVSLAGDVDEDKKVDMDEKTALSTQKPSGLAVVHTVGLLTPHLLLVPMSC